MSARSSSPRSTRTIPGSGLRSVILPLRGKRHPELGRLRLVVTRAGETDAMTLKPECASPTEALKSELAATLRKRGGYIVFVGYPVAGFHVDVVAQRGNQALAIACDGDPERRALPDDPHSLDSVSGQAILERAGWRVHRIPYRRWQLDPDGCLAEIDALLGAVDADEAG